MKLKKLRLKPGGIVQISGSKSISNRLLILQKLYGKLSLENLSNSHDIRVMKDILDHEADIVDVHHSGTAMRLLTSYFAIQKGKRTVITGSDGLKKRPMKPLVDALRTLGAEIEYLGNEGYPPLGVLGTEIEKSFVKIPAHISSQFVTSLLLIGAKLKNGLTVELDGEITSRPYLDMTCEILKEIGISLNYYQNKITILPYTGTMHQGSVSHYDIESDWSSASYFYAMVAIGRESIDLQTFRTYSLQGDALLQEIYWNNFGVNTASDSSTDKISLIPEKNYEFPKKILLNMNDCPDIAPTVCTTAAALKIPFEISGLATLKIKETDRISALQHELLKIGVETEITENSIKSKSFGEPQENCVVETYGDHRMAMSFAPLCLLRPIEILDTAVVEKSYPHFWRDLHSITEEVD